MAAHAALFEIAVVTLAANARYMLMSCALSQRLGPDTKMGHPVLIGGFLTKGGKGLQRDPLESLAL